MDKNDFFKQLEFIIEIDKVKQVFRRTKLFDQSRFENDAEHSWHLAIMAILLSKYSNSKIDLLKVIKMVLIHDLVEIDAGDVIVYDTDNRREAKKKEKLSADRIFGLLPEEQGSELKSIWEEFETRESAEAKFAAAIDRFEPILQNKLSEYETWKKHEIKLPQLYEKNQHIKDGSVEIWEYVESLFLDAHNKGYV